MQDFVASKEDARVEQDEIASRTLLFDRAASEGLGFEATKNVTTTHTTHLKREYILRSHFAIRKK